MAGLELETWEIVCYSFIFLFGLTGNLIVCVVVIKSGPAFRDVPFNVYLMGLAITDMVLAVVCLPVYVMSTAGFHHPQGALGTIFCKVVTGYLFPFWFGGASVYLLVIISFERYSAVKDPLAAHTRRTSNRTFTNIVAAWAIGFIIQVPTVIELKYFSRDAKVRLGNSCAFSWKDKKVITSVYVVAFILQYALPAIIFVINFFRIKQCLGTLDEDLKRSFKDLAYQKRVMKNKRKTVRIVFIVSAAFFLCWTPNNVMYFLFQYAGKKDIAWNSRMYQVGIVLGFLNSCINPALFAFQSKDFRAHCKRIFKKIFKISDSKSKVRAKMVSSTVRVTTTSDKKDLLKYAA